MLDQATETDLIEVLLPDYMRYAIIKLENNENN